MALYEQYPPRVVDASQNSPRFLPASPGWSTSDIPPPYSPRGFEDQMNMSSYPQTRRRSIQMSEYPPPRTSTPKYDIRGEPPRIPTPNAPFYVPPSHYSPRMNTSSPRMHTASPRMNTASPRQQPQIQYPQQQHQQMYEVPDPPIRSHTPFFIRENGRQLEPLQEQFDQERDQERGRERPMRPQQTRMMHYRYRRHRSQDRYRREGSRDDRSDRNERDERDESRRFEHRRMRASVLRHHPYRQGPRPDSFQYRGRRR